MNWGASYYDHLERLFRSPISRETFSQEPDEPTIQVLAYDRVFPRCRVFASLGLSHYARQVGRVAEVYLAVDDGWTEAGAILANALFYVIQNELPIGWGMAVGGVGAVTPAFAQQFAKTALYFTNPFGLPRQVPLTCTPMVNAGHCTWPCSSRSRSIRPFCARVLRVLSVSCKADAWIRMRSHVRRLSDQTSARGVGRRPTTRCS